MSVKLFREPELQDPSLLVGWSPDVGNLGPLVLDFLKRTAGAEEFGEIEPLGFFPVAGVEVDDDVIQFPACRFYACPGRNLAILESWQPRAKPYAFLNLALDVAQRLKAREIFTVGGLAVGVPQAQQRRISAVTNGPGLPQSAAYQGPYVTYHGPPSTSSFLLWLAAGRGIRGTSFWQEIPFYLARAEDWQGARAMLELLDRMLGLRLPLTSLDETVQEQAAELQRLRDEDPGIASLLDRLEKNGGVTEDEGQNLATMVGRFLKKRPDSW